MSGFIRARNALLLVRQTRRFRDHWLLPGGAVERGETLGNALVREIHEECGLRVQVEEGPLALVQTISPDGGKTRHLIQLIFEARPVGAVGTTPSTPPPGEPGDPAIKELRWYTPRELVTVDIHPPIRDLLIWWMGLREEDPLAPIPFVCTGPLWAEE